MTTPSIAEAATGLSGALLTKTAASNSLVKARADVKAAKTHLRAANAEVKSANASLFAAIGRKPRKAKAKKDSAAKTAAA